MILKFLLIVAVIAIVYFLFIKNKPSLSESKKGKEQTSEMVECAECGIFVELDESILSGAKYYCSKECLAKDR